ncbi:MAG: hypothetical protein M1826_003681 [Phylliscum demangeonii]|nr:MAG: hypothetical protein M1826_003681 [Phylliscum demangeonii]
MTMGARRGQGWTFSSSSSSSSSFFFISVFFGALLGSTFVPGGMAAAAAVTATTTNGPYPAPTAGFVNLPTSSLSTMAGISGGGGPLWRRADMLSSSSSSSSSPTTTRTTTNTTTSTTTHPTAIPLPTESEAEIGPDGEDVQEHKANSLANLYFVLAGVVVLVLVLGCCWWHRRKRARRARDRAGAATALARDLEHWPNPLPDSTTTTTITTRWRSFGWTTTAGGGAADPPPPYSPPTEPVAFLLPSGSGGNPIGSTHADDTHPGPPARAHVLSPSPSPSPRSAAAAAAAVMVATRRTNPSAAADMPPMPLRTLSSAGIDIGHGMSTATTNHPGINPGTGPGTARDRQAPPPEYRVDKEET